MMAILGWRAPAAARILAALAATLSAWLGVMAQSFRCTPCAGRVSCLDGQILPQNVAAVTPAHTILPMLLKYIYKIIRICLNENADGAQFSG